MDSWITFFLNTVESHLFLMSSNDEVYYVHICLRQSTRLEEGWSSLRHTSFHSKPFLRIYLRMRLYRADILDIYEWSLASGMTSIPKYRVVNICEILYIDCKMKIQGEIQHLLHVILFNISWERKCFEAEKYIFIVYREGLRKARRV